MIKLLRFNKEPLIFSSDRLIEVVPNGNLIRVNYLDSAGNTLSELGYYLTQS